MKGTLGAGLVLALPLSACGNDDASVLTDANASPTSASSGGSRPPDTNLPVTTPPGTAPVATPGPAVSGTATAGRGSTSGQLRISFTFAAQGGGGRVNNPFIAVWIEDASGALVRTVSLWYSQRDAKYLQELSRWYSVDDGGRTDDAVDTVSGGSKVPGTYMVTWDRTNHTGTAVPAGDYFVCIEAAREHGPSELVRESVTIGTTAFTKQLNANGELTAAAVELVG